MSIPPVELGSSNDVKILYCTETANYIQFMDQSCQKYASHSKKLQMKVVQNRILYKKVRSAYVYLPHNGVGDLKDWSSWNIIYYLNKPTKFDSEQLSFEPFLDVMRIFGSVEP